MCKGSNVFSLTILMVEGLACFRVDISQKEKSMVVPAAVDFLLMGLSGGDLSPLPPSPGELVKGGGITS